MRRGGGRIAVIGVGNPMRRDDAAGLEIVERARPRLPRGVVVGRCAGDATTLLDAWAGRDVAVVVDAARWPGAVPGEVLWIEDAAGATGSLPWSDGFGTHGLGVSQAIHLGRALRRLPGRLEVLAVAIAEDGQGDGLTPSVEAAVARAADLLVERVGATTKGGR